MYDHENLGVDYARTGNSKFAAETIAAELGVEMEEVVDLKNRKGRLSYMSGGRDAMSRKETEIAPTKINPANYELIVLVQSVWAWSPTPAIRTYAKMNDLSGKKIALFFGSSSLRQAFKKTKALMPNSIFIGELAVEEPLKNKEKAEKEIAAWCSSLKNA
jgi:flavodoxin